MNKLLRLPAVCDAVGVRKTCLYERIRTGTFTRPVPLSARSVVWPSSEIEAINAAIIAGAGNDELRTLVNRLHDMRRAANDASDRIAPKVAKQRKIRQRLQRLKQ